MQPLEHIPATRMQRPRRRGKQAVSARLGDALIELLGRLPQTDELACATPDTRARTIGEAAARKAAMVAGTLALPPGPLGWLTVLPELYAIWKIQAQMVADIAGTYGRRWQLTREQMMFCLFRHTAAQALRDIAVQAGERWLVQTASLAAMRTAARRIGVRLSERGIGSGIARWLPVIGAMGVGAYAWYDTRQVARTAIELFAGKHAANASAVQDEDALFI
jgi:transposase